MSFGSFPLSFPLTKVNAISSAVSGIFEIAEDFFVSWKSPAFWLPLTNSILPLYAGGLVGGSGGAGGAAGVPTSTRATTAYQTDFEGKQNLVLSGEARFQGARRARNVVNINSESPASYTPVNAGGGAVPTVTNSQSDAWGGTTAVRVQANAGGATGGDFSYIRITSGLGGLGRYSLWIKSNTGVPQVVMVNMNSSLVVTATTTWQRMSPAAATGGTMELSVGTRGNISDQVVDVLIARWQIENVTGQTNQNPSEYVSVGVASSPWFGANVDGVKYFSTLNGNTVASNVVTEATGAAINSSTSKFAVLPGVVGSNFSTPASAATNQTGNIDIRVKASASWTTAPAAAQYLAGTWNGASGYVLYLSTEPRLHFTYTPNSGAEDVSSLVSVGLPDNTATWVRATLQLDNGSAQHVVTFYTSQDGITWSTLATRVIAGAQTVPGAANALSVGDADGSHPIKGNIYRAQIYNGINGTLAVDFNPNTWTSGATWSSASTGEVWTINGTAKVFGSNADATYGIPAQWDANGPFGEISTPAQTDLLGVTDAIRRTMSDAGWVATNVTKGTATGADGTAAIAASLTATAGNGTALFTTVLGAAVRTFGALVRRKTGAGVINITGDNGVTWTAITLTTQYQPFYFTTASAANPVVGFRIVTSTDAIEVDFNTLVAGSNKFPVFTPTNVNEAADVLQYVSAGNVPTNDFVVYGEVSWPVVQPAASYYLWSSYVDANNSTSILWDGTNLIARRRIGGVNTDATKALTPTAGTRYKWAARFSSTTGTDIFHSGAIGTNDATNTACQIGAAFQVGADGNGAGQPYAEVSNIKIYVPALPTAYLTAMTT